LVTNFLSQKKLSKILSNFIKFKKFYLNLDFQLAYLAAQKKEESSIGSHLLFFSKLERLE